MMPTTPTFEDLRSSSNFRERIGKRATFFARQLTTELFAPREQRVTDTIQDFRALLHAGVGPDWKGRACGLGRLLDLRLIRLSIFTDHITRVGGVAVDRPGRAFHPAARNVVSKTLDSFHGTACSLLLPGGLQVIARAPWIGPE
jgi:hypothetical protein